MISRPDATRSRRAVWLACAIAGVALAAGLAAAAPARAVTPDGQVTEFAAGISAGSAPYGIAQGPDGNLWFTEQVGNRLGRITPQGQVTEFATGITAVSFPTGIAQGPDGNLWFTERGGDRIGRITPQGQVTEFATGISAGSLPTGIAQGPDGNLWFTELGGDRIGRITPQGQVTEFAAGIRAGSGPTGIAQGPDGNMWFTEKDGDRIGRITTGATRTLTVARTGTGTGAVTSTPAGIDCGATCSAAMDYLGSVTLTAAAAGGSRFTGWIGEGCAGTGTCSVTMDAARSVTATFAPDPATVRGGKATARVTRTAVVLSSRVTVDRAGTIAQRLTTGAEKIRIWCRTSRTVAAAGTYTLTCNLGTAGRRYIRAKALTGTVRTTFTPTGEPAVRATRAVAISRRR